jgi:hypothetical protein
MDVRRVLGALVLVMAACTLLALAGARGASANHGNTLCDSGSGDYSNNEKRFLQYHYINWSVHFSNGDFIAIREDIGGNETFRQWYPAWSEISVTTPDGYDRYLRAGIQRAGYPSHYWYVTEYSHLYC